VHRMHLFLLCTSSPFRYCFFQLDHEYLPRLLSEHIERAAFPKRTSSSSLILSSRVRSCRSTPSSRAVHEGIVVNREDGFYSPSTKRIKIKNPNYTQAEGRRELFESLRSARSAFERPDLRSAT
jgi:hypothetical protein